jgi:hypothetical protein
VFPLLIPLFYEWTGSCTPLFVLVEVGPRIHVIIILSYIFIATLNGWLRCSMSVLPCMFTYWKAVKLSGHTDQGGIGRPLHFHVDPPLSLWVLLSVSWVGIQLPKCVVTYFFYCGPLIHVSSSHTFKKKHKFDPKVENHLSASHGSLWLGKACGPIWVVDWPSYGGPTSSFLSMLLCLA